MLEKDDLARFPRPNVAVDIAVLSVLPRQLPHAIGSLAVLIEGEPGGRTLPGRFLREGQTISECVVDVLSVKAGMSNVRAEPRLLRAFDDPRRDPRAWTLSLAHSLTLPPRLLRGARGALVPIAAGGQLVLGEPLLFDHDAIVSEAAAAIRERYERLPDPDGLLEEPFTIAELKSLHEAVIGVRLLKDTFRRRMEPNLRPLAEADGARLLRSDGGRPAQVFTRRADLEPEAAIQRRGLLPRAAR